MQDYSQSQTKPVTSLSINFKLPNAVDRKRVSKTAMDFHSDHSQSPRKDSDIGSAFKERSLDFTITGDKIGR
jgi:UDP-N-acetylenolpyruvoylglucosamine reductase